VIIRRWKKVTKRNHRSDGEGMGKKKSIAVARHCTCSAKSEVDAGPQLLKFSQAISHGAGTEHGRNLSL
jgi:hypothetical protein